MFNQYPHILTFHTEGNPDVWDEINGGWIPGAQGSEVNIKCRAVPAGPGSVTKLQDGTVVKYDFDLVFPFDTVAVPQWTEVVIKDADGNLIIGDRIKRYQRGQAFHNKGWI